MCRIFVTVTTRFRRVARSAQSCSSTVSLICGSSAACDTGRGRSAVGVGLGRLECGRLRQRSVDAVACRISVDECGRQFGDGVGEGVLGVVRDAVGIGEAGGGVDVEFGVGV